MARRFFTPAQANKTLPLVKRVVTDILEIGREVRQLGAARHTDANRTRLEELGNEMERLLTELRQIGCDYKDWSFDKGLVDFPSVIDGRPVLLCWRSDEPAVTWYHTLEAGFAGRTEIPAEMLALEGELEIDESAEIETPDGSRSAEVDELK